MKLYYVRHGDPIYQPDSLTPLGYRQAEAVGKRLSLHGLDEVYCSTSERAKLTAKPTCEMLKLEPQLLDFANESHAWEQLTYDTSDGLRWLFNHPESRSLMTDPSVREMGFKWYEHPFFEKYDYKRGMDRIYDESDKFLLSLGYEHIRERGLYRVRKENDKRVALFAHAGFGITFLSVLLDIPYPWFCVHFDMCHTGVTLIDFESDGEYCAPRICTLSSEAHIYKDGLPLSYNNSFYF